MDFFSLEFLSALLTIVFIDLILAGDNAIVIGMASRNLPKHLQKKAVILGTVGAVAIRAVATILVVYLLDIPWLLLAGGILLLWIAYNLLTSNDDHGDIRAGSTLGAAVRTIIIADAAMGLDNVIAVAGAAHGNYVLVILGLIISIPIVVWGSTLFIKLIGRFPWIVYLGSGVLAYTAAKMITHEQKIASFFDQSELVRWSFMMLVVILIIAAGLWTNMMRARRTAAGKSRETH
ncbi:TerC family protein [Paenibacillus mendelii]|uniref:TerC family protein n=1 Tax=Paenibacillus mendelii TaxID=206163 RepID=A0ABV6JHL9_9BACL|nr:TerC family protein [Paenibacillus mendelii]MCQ6558297.1 TerC family protein [Paenibacillus mendelii]